MQQDKQKAKKSSDMTVREAGRKGGEATSASHGPQFYEEIGHKGGQKGGRRVRELIEEGKRAECKNEE